MSNADRLRSWHGLPLSARLVDIGLVEQYTPSTSSHPSLAHPGQWIRSDTRRYTQQGAAFQNSNHVLPTALAPPTLKSKYIPATIQRTLTIRYRLQKTPLLGTGAPHRAPRSVRMFTSDANIHQAQVPLDMVVCRQHTQPTRDHTTNPTLKPNVVNVSSNTNHQPTYRHILLRDRPAHVPNVDHHNLRSHHAGRPLAPLISVLQPPPAPQDLGTASEPSTTYHTLKPNLVNMSSNSNHPPTHIHMPLRDRPANAPTADPYNPRSYHAGHPLAPLNTVPPPPPAAQDLGTALEPSHVRRLRTPLILAAPKSTTDPGRAADLPTHADDPYRYDRPALSQSKDQSSTPRPLPLAYDDNIVNNALKSIPFPHLSASEPQCFCEVLLWLG
jgi:hypothetical protein